jgi:hypothetical protein
MSRRVVVAVLALLLCAALPPLASAQTERPGAVYVSALLNVPWSQGLTEDTYQIYVLPPGGWSLGWSVLGGVFVAPRASVEFEFSRTGIVDRTEPSRYGYTYYEERRDNFFTTALRLHTRPQRSLDIEPVVGFDVVKEENWRTEDYLPYTGYPGPVTHYPRSKSTVPAVPGFSTGVDLRIGSGHTAFVASFRIHRTFWRQTGDFDETKRWTLRPGAGLRVSF